MNIGLVLHSISEEITVSIHNAGHEMHLPWVMKQSSKGWGNMQENIKNVVIVCKKNLLL